MDRVLKPYVGAAQVAARLRREITAGIWSHEERLPSERRLAETLGVARGTVRRALGRLVSEGLLAIRQGSGAYVVFEPPGDSNPVFEPVFENARPLELIDARFALEPHMCRLAVLHARPHDFDEAEELLEGMENSSTDPVMFSALDTAFHLWLARTTGNSLLVWIVGQINSVRAKEEWSRMRQITLTEGMIATYNEQHRQIVNAIHSREPEQAATLMKEHLETARLSLTRAVT